MSVIYAETHSWRRPGPFFGLFPGVCLGLVTFSWGRGTMAEAMERAGQRVRSALSTREAWAVLFQFGAGVAAFVLLLWWS